VRDLRDTWLPKIGRGGNSMAVHTDKRFLRWVIVLMVAGILLTRGLTLSHGMMLQPDEYIFYFSSTSLVDGQGYQPVKAYPEGSFLLQAPFQALRLWLDGAVGLTVTDQQAGRIASVVYFAVGASLGCYLVLRLSRRRSAVALYALIMVFALFQIEQSRYGTGDPPSFCLLMLVLVLLERYFRSGRKGPVFASAFAVGVMAAVKYPQIYFLLLPVLAVARQKKLRAATRLWMIAGMLLAAAAGFLCFSPSIFQPGYLAEILKNETEAYVNHPNLWAVGTPWGHLLNLLLYHLLYADVPLAPVLMAAGLLAVAKAELQADFRGFFLITVPLVFGVFYLYNLFVPSLFFRTYYTFFCVAALYTAAGLGALCGRKWLRIAAAVLVAAMAVRGAYLVYLLAQPEKKLPDVLEAHDLWYDGAAVTVLGSNFLPGHANGTLTKIPTDEVFLHDDPEFDAGAYVVTQPYQFALARSGLFPIANEDVKTISEQWKLFRENYDVNLFYKQYPDFYYYLFGYWLEGGTGTTYEFPTIYYYFID